jgi:N-acetylglucosaminyldiphosphoundecaprenol N-acetyl-beta-D-mannosaminyltransferase
VSRRPRILNGAFDPLDLAQTVDKVMAHVREGRRGWLCTVNVAILMMMRGDPWLQSFVDRASFVVADGQPLVWFAATFSGTGLPARVAGIDLVYAISRRAQQAGVRVGLIGAKRSVVETVAERLRELYPRLQVSYDANGAADRADAIRKAKVDILFVGMGVPRQERFIDEQWERLGVSMAIGVGGSFDVLAGLRARAPELLQRTSMEWAYRLAQEPRRLWKRYLVTNSQFLWLLGRQLVRNAVGASSG